MVTRLKFKQALLISTFLGAGTLLSVTFMASPSTYIRAQQQHQEKQMNSNLFNHINANSTSNSSMSSMMARGNIAMGFNQGKIMHHFIATPLAVK
jgi:hypothetical protein